jgi:tetratricopeptide (TPR) repeat protein
MKRLTFQHIVLAPVLMSAFGAVAPVGAQEKPPSTATELGGTASGRRMEMVAPPSAQPVTVSGAERAAAGLQAIADGDAAYGAGQYDAAISKYTEALSSGLDLSPIYLKRGGAFLRKGDGAAALADYDEAIRLRPDDPDAYEKRGDAFFSLDEFDAAIADYERALALESKSEGPSAKRARARKKQDVERLLAGYEYNGGVRLRTTVRLLVRRGHAQRKGGSLASAAASYTEALRLAPNAEAYNNRGNIRADIGEYWAAIDDYGKALAITPNDATIYVNRGNVFTHLKQFETAIDDYNKALELNPEQPYAYLNRAAARYKSGEFGAAADDCTAFLKLARLDRHLGYFNRALAYGALGKTSEAIADLREALALKDDFRDAKVELQRLGAQP